MTNELIMTNHVNSSKLMLKTDHLAKNLYHYKKKKEKYNESEYNHPKCGKKSKRKNKRKKYPMALPR